MRAAAGPPACRACHHASARPRSVKEVDEGYYADGEDAYYMYKDLSATEAERPGREEVAESDEGVAVGAESK